MLRDEPRQRDRQVKPHADVASAMILETVKLLVGLVAPFAGENFEVLQRGRVDRAEAVRAIHAPRGLDQPLARNHRLGQIIAKAFQRARFDAIDKRGSSAKNRQQRRRFAADVALGRAQHGLGIFGDLLGGLEVLVVHPIVLVLAVVRRVFAAHLWPSGVNPAAVVLLQVLALGVDQQVPGAVLRERRRGIVQQKPADVFKVLQLIRFVDRQRKISATLGRAMVAQHAPLRYFFAPQFLRL